MGVLEQIGKEVQSEFSANRRVLSFAEYMQLVEKDAGRHCRNAAEYTRDMFDHFGTRQVRHPRGEIRRFKLFDVPFDNGRGRLVAHEATQNAIYRVLTNFARQGRVDRFILLHGPNGSAKSTIAEILARGVEHYSTLDEGALYRFNWIFPSQRSTKSGIGFGGEKAPLDRHESYAHLDEEEVDARLPCELRDHPLLLVPKAQRADFIKKLAPGFEPSDYLLHGELCQKCKLIYESLLAACEGDYLRVLRHIQVERFYISRRYRLGATRVEPQLAVDARTRQITADRSLAALPTALQSIALYEVDGELVQANRGMVDFADLLKRPLEASKYLLTAVEDGHVALDQTNLFFDLVFVGSANETHLNAFMESPEWMSFKARFELVRVPYIRDYECEKKIYQEQLPASQLGKHLAPLTLELTAMWAVLSRMHKPSVKSYDDPLKELVGKLTPADKAALYAEGKTPVGLSDEQAKLLSAAIPNIYDESGTSLIYEGRTGASPREVKTVVMNAAQKSGDGCVTAELVLKELADLVEETSIYPFLRQEVKSPGYYDHKGFIEVARNWYLDRSDARVWGATGLAEESRHADLFGRYMEQVTHLVRNEKIHNPVTGAHEDPDQNLMKEVEKALKIEGDIDEFRQSLMTRIGAWSVDNPGEKPTYTEIFASHYQMLRQSYYKKQKQRVVAMLKDALVLLSEEKPRLPKQRTNSARAMLKRLKEDHDYCDVCAQEVISQLMKTRYTD
jgi:serine protein kinase